MKAQGQFSLPGNPVANIITVVLGVLTLIAAAAFGFVLLVGFLVALTAFGSFIAARLWWLKRKLGKAGAEDYLRQRMGGSPPARTSGETIEADYEVIESERQRKP